MNSARPRPTFGPDPCHDPGHDACGVGFLADQQGRARFDILPLALTALGRLDHRGAVGSDGETGDGAGVLTAIPWAVLVAEPGNGIEPDMAERGLGLASLFLPAGPVAAAAAMEAVARGLARAGLRIAATRNVPSRDALLGRLGRESKPRLIHAVIERPESPALDDDAYEHRLFVGRKEIEAIARAEGIEGLYVASLSHRTVVYKALLRGSQLGAFYNDLQSRAFRTPFAVFHNRFSTNTHPSWPRTQPFRLLAHNGEINTIDGNRRWMEARAKQGDGLRIGLREESARRLLALDESDSASLDEALRLLMAAGHETSEALAMLMPPAWEHDARIEGPTRAFFEGASTLMEPWDGPALIAFSDGRVAGARLDRNGLRPARSVRTVDGLVFVGSEMGALDVAPERIALRGRLGPGDFLAVDLVRGSVIDRAGLEAALGRSPLARTPAGELLTVGEGDASSDHLRAEPDLQTLKAFGYTREELQFVLGPMARDGVEPVGSMGDDAPLACLSEKPQLLFSFFKQRFAQVTNPPIDPLRERLVMSLRTSLGPIGSPFDHRPAPRDGERLLLQSPVLSERAFAAIEAWPDDRGASLSLLFPGEAQAADGEMERALQRVVLAAVREVQGGACRVVLTDRGVDARYAAIPSLLAVSAVHQQLLALGLRLRASLVVESAEPRDDHQIAALLAFGANAVCPYGALAAARRFVRDDAGAATQATAGSNVVRVLEKGLLKILSKMGIATMRSYQGAQLFESVGLDLELIARHFTGTPARIEGHGLAEIERDVRARHTAAFAPSEAAHALDEGSAHRYRRNGEAHAYEPPVVKALHALIRSGERLDARRYAKLVEERPAISVRDLFRIRDVDASTLSIDEVEPARSIFPRFSTAAMSLGSLSPEAHGALAIAMNRIGALSNSGEGGESPDHYWRTLPGGDRPNHRIKQVASARFGVTTDYLVAADELQIKIAQGSKPGEGGQLPGRKVVGEIARVRHAPEGATLISPPPHHDIYSIEDLAQLIHDLRSVNPAAAISVKLVSSSGIGAIAAGVVKAGADTIVIGGHDGGTGASPLSSIKNAGTPWELGLIEVQQTLLEQHLRGRVRLRVEGGLKTGRDVVIAAALGADEFAFGSAALVAAGCVMARQCHLNTCPVGIATQREDLRRNFRASPDAAVRFVTAIAEETREILANLGRRSLEEIVGDASLLTPRALPADSRAARVSVAGLLPAPGRAGVMSSRGPSTRNTLEDKAAGPDVSVLTRIQQADGLTRLDVARPITVADRSVGALLAGEIARTRRGKALPADTLHLSFRGSAGQSFGAFATRGMTLTLEGEANDYVGKGLSGGEIVLRPRRQAGSVSAGEVIAGNTVLYGATAGRLFAAGRVGERFAVRLSGAVAVVEGAGDHACEYMTAGTVAILGPVGRNFGAGMTGGLAYVFDPDGTLTRHLSADVAVESGELADEDARWLHEACRRHVEATGSVHARALLQNWPQARGAFRRIAAPHAVTRPVPWASAAAGTSESGAILESVA